MKNLGLTAVMLLLTVTMFAINDNPTIDRSRITVKSNTGTAVMIRMINLEHKWATIDLRNAENDLVFTKKIKNKVGFATKLDLSRLSSGEYTLIVNREKKTYQQKLFINEEGVVSIEKMKQYRKPAIDKKRNYFRIYNPSQDIESVSILNEKGKVMYVKNYESKEKTTESVKYDLKKVPRGNYQVKVTTNTTSYYFDVFVN